MSSLLTFAQLRERPDGLDLKQHLALIRTALASQLDAMTAITKQVEVDGRSALRASEQRTHDEHAFEHSKLTALYAQIADSPEGREVDYSQVVWHDGDGDTTQRSGLQRGYHTGGGATYNRDDVRTSWVRDLVSASRNDVEATARLRANDREVEVETRALSTGTGAGGEFVVPAWLLEQALKLSRPGRVIADRVQKMQLPRGTDSVSLPRMVTGTAVAEQASQNTSVQNTDATFSSISADVATIAGMQVLSLQLLEQSPVPVDQIVLQDLLDDLAVKIDRFVISNNATNKVGILNVTGVNAVSYTDTTPTAAELTPKVADAVQLIHTKRFLPATEIWMHPRRWGWLTAQVDSTGRPLVVPSAQGPMNSTAAMGATAAQGYAGSMNGLDVYLDPNLPINAGVGTNEDRIVVARPQDIVLMESTPAAHVLRERFADQLSVGIVLHSYVALHASRYPESVSIISGTGLVTPVF